MTNALTTPRAVTPLTARVFAEGMALLAERWNREISPSMSRLYAEGLKDLGAELFIVGVKLAIDQETFFPSPARIRELARPTVSADVRAGEMLGKVLAAGVHGPNGRTWSLTTIAEKCGGAAARAYTAVGGGYRLAALTDADFPFLLRDFTKAFAAYADEAVASDAVTRRLEAERSAPQLGTGAKKQVGAGVSPIADIIAAAIPADLLPALAEVAP